MISVKYFTFFYLINLLLISCAFKALPRKFSRLSLEKSSFFKMKPVIKRIVIVIIMITCVDKARILI